MEELGFTPSRSGPRIHALDHYTQLEAPFLGSSSGTPAAPRVGCVRSSGKPLFVCLGPSPVKCDHSTYVAGLCRGPDGGMGTVLRDLVRAWRMDTLCEWRPPRI